MTPCIFIVNGSKVALARSRRVLFIFGLLTISICFTKPTKAQQRLTDLPPIDVSFFHIEPYYNKPQSATNFMWEFYTKTEQLIGDQSSSRCLFAIGSIRFRLLDSGKIDQIVIKGDSLPEYLPGFFRSRVEGSQPYWTCHDCKNRGAVLITIPVFIHYEVGCRKGIDPTFKAAVELIFSIYERGVILPIEGIQTGQRELLLKPIVLFSIS